MVHILRTISIASLILAALVVALHVRSQWWSNSQVTRTETVSAIDRFKQMAEGKADQVLPQTPPLIQQAQAFALHLNPPHPPQPLAKPAPQVSSPMAQVQSKPPSSSAKFELHGISYYRPKPEESMALICEPGTGRRWVKQGDKLGHVTIEKITSTTIVYKDGDRTQEVALASDQALTRYAKDRDGKMAPKLPGPDLSKPSPPPVRGIRQMPAAYAAAKMGLQLGRADAPTK
jgi:hypothetical protein